MGINYLIKTTYFLDTTGAEDIFMVQSMVSLAPLNVADERVVILRSGIVPLACSL